MHTQKGFTLVELIIVIIVIGILASIALPRYTTVVERARMSEGKHVLGVIRSAQMSYSSIRGSYAKNMTDLEASFTTLKYFYAPNLTNAGSPKANPELAQIKRTDNNAGDFAFYCLTIYEDGTLNCTPFNFPRYECPE